MAQPKEEISNLDLKFYEFVILLNSFLDQDYLSSIVEHADPTYFENPDVRVILKHVLKFFADNGTVPTMTEVKSRLKDEEKKPFDNVVGQFKTMDPKFNKEELLSNTERFLKEKCLYKTIMETANRFSNGEMDAGVALAEFEKAYNINLKEDMGHWYFENVDQHIKDLLALYNPMKTGWKFLDEKLEGGLYPKTLTCIIGQVNIGKSIFLGNIATNLVRDNRNVLLITLEMSEFMYAKRVSSQITQIPHNQLKVYTKELKEQLEEVGKNLESKLVIKEFPPKSITVRQIDGYMSKLLHKGFKPDVVVVDYINLIRPSTKNLNSYEGVKEVAEQLRALAFKYHIPVVTASQIRRCLDSDTGINMADGTTKALSDIVIGDKLRSWDISKETQTTVEVKHIYPEEKQECFEITLESGESIVCSAKHMFPTERGIRSIETGLEEGDFVIVENRT